MGCLALVLFWYRVLDRHYDITPWKLDAQKEVYSSPPHLHTYIPEWGEPGNVTKTSPSVNCFMPELLHVWDKIRE